MAPVPSVTQTFISKIELQCKLDETRVPCSNRVSELRRAKFHGKRLLTDGSWGTKQRIDMIPDVKEFGAEFQVHLLANREYFKNGEIPVLEAGSANNISAGVAKSKERGVIGESAGVEERARRARFSVGFPDDIGSDFVVTHNSATVSGRDVGNGVGDREPIAGLCGNNTCNLPIPYDLVQNAVSVCAKSLALPEGQLISVAGDEAMPHIEVGISVFQPRVQLIPEVSVVQRT